MLRKLLCLLGFHQWDVNQYNVAADVCGPPWVHLTIAWKQCPHCAKSKLIHILK